VYRPWLRADCKNLYTRNSSSQAGLFASCMAMWCHSLFISCAQFRKALSLVHWRQNCCYPAQVTAAPRWLASIWYQVPTLPLPAAMFFCSALTSLPIWVWITTSPLSALAVTTDFINSDVSGGCWTPCWRHSSKPLWVHGLTTATLFLLVHQGQ